MDDEDKHFQNMALKGVDIERNSNKSYRLLVSLITFRSNEYSCLSTDAPEIMRVTKYE